ncbi:MAG TPA: protein-L-isoaspartate(D-aspartate) O-methyltransferase [Phycisphaerae bacterium]|nr:protein-L-isoaspartate(D-aspartate) O-methyltransferase [Phycisphaerae bacterium]HRW52829.1 protein-L-isoaspartate(D-aspartate) O-methyltransferase [Phycisphaerae bacterium]
MFLMAIGPPACNPASRATPTRVAMTQPADNAEPARIDPPARPRTTDRRDERLAMVRTQIEDRDVRDPRVLNAMRDTPRHWFVPDEDQARAYADRPLPIGAGQTISQPYIVALMSELIELAPHEKVLEIGTGSGYQAAVLSELTDDVYTIEIIEPLARRAIATFEARGYRNIHARIGDGYRGWPDAAPFDAIIVTCAPEEIPQPLIDQLAPDGRLCIPVGPNNERGQQLIVVTKRANGELRREVRSAVRFVPMTGEAFGGR